MSSGEAGVGWGGGSEGAGGCGHALAAGVGGGGGEGVGGCGHALAALKYFLNT